MSIQIIPVTSNSIEFYRAYYLEMEKAVVFQDRQDVEMHKALLLYTLLVNEVMSVNKPLAMELSKRLSRIVTNMGGASGIQSDSEFGRCTYTAVQGRPYHHQFLITFVKNKVPDVFIFQIHSPLAEKEITKSRIHTEDNSAV